MFNRAQAAVANGKWSVAIESLQNLSLVELQQHSELVLDLAFPILIEGDFEQQWEIAKIIPKLGEIAIQPLLDLLNDCEIDLEDRWVVARILGDFHQPQVITGLIALIQQREDPELTEIATSALAKIGVPAIAPIAELLETADRSIAVTTLAQIRHSHTIEPLIQVVDDPDSQIRTLSIEALGSFHDPRIPPILLRKLTDPAPTVRTAAVVALCFRSDLAAELELSQHLRPLLFDLNLAVAQATALGLARLPDRSILPLLAEVLLDPATPTELKSSVILALGWIDTQPAIDILIAAIPNQSIQLAAEIVISIGKISQFQVYASHRLVDYLYSDSIHPAIVKQQIATALGNLGDINVVPELLQLLEDSEDRVRLHARAAILKLSPDLLPTGNAIEPSP